MKIGDISSLWNNLFYPVLSTIIVFLSLFYIFGKDSIRNFFRSVASKTDRLIFGDDTKPVEETANKQDGESIGIDKTENKENGKETDEVIATEQKQSRINKILSVGIKEAVKKPITWLFGFFLICFAVYRLMLFYSNSIFPITYSFSTTEVAYHVVSKDIIAQIWARFPDDTFQTLCSRISQMGSESSFSKNFDYGPIDDILLWLKFINIVALMSCLIATIKRKWKIAFRGIIAFALSTVLILGSLYFQFTKQEHKFQQEAYYTYTAVLLDGEVDWDIYVQAEEKADYEYKLYEHEGTDFLHGFGISFVEPLR